MGYETLPVGPEFQVNTYTSNSQSEPSVTSLSDGGFVVIWTSGGGSHGDGDGIFGQRYDASGAAIGAEFKMNTYTTDVQNAQIAPSITSLADGGFFVAWTSERQDGSGFGVYGQRYAANGTAIGIEHEINTYTNQRQVEPSITSLADGGYVVTWASEGQDGSGFGIYGQRFSSSGVAVGGEFQINTFTSSWQNEPSVTSLADGGFLVAWSSYGQDGSAYGIYGQRFSASGIASGGEFQINTHTSGFQNEPSATSLADGGFVVTWSSEGQDGSGFGIFGQRYDASGAVAGGEFQINTHTSNEQSDPSVTTLADGGFLVIWSSIGQNGRHSDIYGQRFDATGAAVGEELQINTYITSDQGEPAVTSLADGNVLVTWASLRQDGSSYGVFGQILASNAVPEGAFEIEGEANVGSTLSVNLSNVVDEDGIQDGSGAVNWLRNGVVIEGAVNATYVLVENDIGAEISVRYTYTDGTGVDEEVLTVPTPIVLSYPASTPGTSGDDMLEGTDGQDFMLGIQGDDTLNGDAENDHLSGGDGDDALEGGIGHDTLEGGAGNDVLNGGDGDDSLAGGVGDDTLNGGDGNDTLSGGVGQDVLKMGAGTDLMTGGDGNDIFKLNQAATTDVTIDDFTNGDLLDLSGTSFINSAAAGFSVTVVGHDTVVTAGASTITLTNFVDSSFVNTGILFGRQLGTSGNDTFSGGRNSESYKGQSGDDTISGAGGNDVLLGASGNDLIVGGGGNDLVAGGADNDTLFGNSGNDEIIGWTGDDDIKGGRGMDTISGGEGLDTINGGHEDDILWGNEGDDVIYGNSGNDFLDGGTDDDFMMGGTGNDTMFGSDGADFLNGGRGDDLIEGGSGGDTLVGLGGNDTMTGGTGADVFLFKREGGIQTITDFEDGRDKFNLNLTGVDDIGDVVQTDSGSDLILTMGATTIVLEGLAGTTLTADDFWF